MKSLPLSADQYLKNLLLTFISTSVDICQHQFLFCLNVLVPYKLVECYFLTKENHSLVYYCENIKPQNYIYNELFAFYLNRHIC